MKWSNMCKKCVKWLSFACGIIFPTVLGCILLYAGFVASGNKKPINANNTQQHKMDMVVSEEFSNYPVTQMADVLGIPTKKSNSDLEKIVSSKLCYRISKVPDNLTLFEDILKSDRTPTLDITLFFHVTSCFTDGQVTFTPRQACAIESAAKWNRDRDIFVIFAAPVGYVASEQPSSMLRILKEYPNVHFRTVDWYEYAKGTPSEEWMKEDEIFLSEHFRAHLADTLRYLSIYRFGGIHLDLDFVVQQNFDELPPNFVGKESQEVIGSSIFGFESKYFGHEIMDMILRDNVEKYSPNCWGCTGPLTITRVMQNVCKESPNVGQQTQECQGVRIFESPTFYPIYYPHWKDFFSTNITVIERTLKSATLSKAVHVWNKMSKNTKINKSERPKCAYHILAEENCPRAFGAAGSWF